MWNFIAEFEYQDRIKYLNDLPLEELAQLDLDTHALPKLKRAIRLLNEADLAGDLGQMKISQLRIGWAIRHIGRCLVQGAKLAEEDV
jgi:hypothetical protein